MLADIISVLAMAYGTAGKREALKYRLAGESGAVDEWGHEYVKHLAMEIGQEYKEFVGEMGGLDGHSALSTLTNHIVRFFLDHNAEPDAVDLLVTCEQLPRLLHALNPATDDIDRVCRYLISCAPFEPCPDDVALLMAAHDLYLLQGRFPEALNISIKLNRQDLIKSDFDTCLDK